MYLVLYYRHQYRTFLQSIRILDCFLGLLFGLQLALYCTFNSSLLISTRTIVNCFITLGLHSIIVVYSYCSLTSNRGMSLCISVLYVIVSVSSTAIVGYILFRRRPIQVHEDHFLLGALYIGVYISAIIDVFIIMDVYIYYRDCVYSMYIIRRKTNAYQGDSCLSYPIGKYPFYQFQDTFFFAPALVDVRFSLFLKSSALGP